jgi:hypothetical protein
MKKKIAHRELHPYPNPRRQTIQAYILILSHPIALITIPTGSIVWLALYPKPCFNLLHPERVGHTAFKGLSPIAQPHPKYSQ